MDFLSITNEQLDNIDLFPYSQRINSLEYQQYFMSKSGQEHYRLLAYISQFSSDKSKEFIKSLRTDFNDERSFELIELFKSSNKKIYEDFLENYAMKNLAFFNYLKTETQIYSSLINSKFFVDLKD